MTIATEHEYSINDENFNAVPINDFIIEELSGKIQSEFVFNKISVSRELQKHVIEIKPETYFNDIITMEKTLYHGLNKLFNSIGRYSLLGLGMHPIITLDKTTYWNHQDKEIFDEYNRLFNLKQHGWLNIQALQVNQSYEDEKDLISKYNKVRELLPFIVAISAASPFVEGKPTGIMDNRLIYYMKNQERIPIICNGIIPEKLESIKHYSKILEEIYVELRKMDAELLANEWVNSRGVIIREKRNCIEIKAIDEQESIHSDMAITAFITALLRVEDLGIDGDENTIRELLDEAIKGGTAKLKPELFNLYKKASKVANKEEKLYLPLIETRIEYGSLSEIMLQKLKEGISLKEIIIDAEQNLRNNTSMRY